jgi:hypothetical protein
MDDAIDHFWGPKMNRSPSLGLHCFRLLDLPARHPALTLLPGPLPKRPALGAPV